MSTSNNKKPYVINHKDGNFQNNSLDNLEWIKLPIDTSDGSSYVDEDRSTKKIQAYAKEAADKVWLMHTTPDVNPDIEAVRQQNVERVLKTYSDIPDGGYVEWEDGYWHGVLSALRWVLGDTKDFLDT